MPSVEHSEERVALREFDRDFQALTGHKRLPWQRALFAEFLKGNFPKGCDIPTGLGKTSIIAVWLLALARHARAGSILGFPRRLAYVVNRRTVVDQATAEVETLRKALTTESDLQPVADALRSLTAWPSSHALAISTLRGQFGDNAEWRNDPARPAVIVGTVDMIGSRLLFSGYRTGFKYRPLHAGFLGQDSLLVHDEAHLEPAFQELVATIEQEQRRCGEFRAFRSMALTATSRDNTASFGLTEADRSDETVRARIHAKKGLLLHAVAAEGELAEQVTSLALKDKERGEAILVYLRRLEDVEKVAKGLVGANQSVQTLTGNMRGFERDRLARADSIFARFMPAPAAEPKPGTVYLVCTSAGEVGVNISADHLVCDLMPFDSMAQRFGRVNRFGKGDARVEVVHSGSASVAEVTDDGSATTAGAQSEPATESSEARAATSEPGEGEEGKSAFEEARERTLSLLERLPTRRDGRHDASPASLETLPAGDRQAAFTPPPIILPATDVLFDTWAMTSIRGELPGRPPVEDWLHGVTPWEPPETSVAWRIEVGYLKGALLDRYNPEDILDDYPLKPHELLRDQTRRILKHLKRLAGRHSQGPAWLLAGQAVQVVTLSQLAAKSEDELAGTTLLLPPEVGGLAKGLLVGGADADPDCRYDVADELQDQDDAPLRVRLWDDAPPPHGMRLVRTIDTRPDADEGETDADQSPKPRFWHWYVRPRAADDDGSQTAPAPQPLDEHLESAARFAATLVAALELHEPEASAVIAGARWHDCGKRRGVWQRSIGNWSYPSRVLAKSADRTRPLELTGYRHEFGSLLDASSDSEFSRLSEEAQDVALHLIAAHHGRARPQFPVHEVFDPEKPQEAAIPLALEVPRRYARLQRRYGRWGLAYIESLLRAADALASQATDSTTEPVGPQPREPQEPTP